MKSSLIFPVLAAALCSSLAAPESEKPAVRHGTGHVLYPPNQIQWQNGPPSLPAGAKFALLEGNPAEEGFFTMRIWMPDGYKIPPHTHPKVEHVTVISGTFNFGIGEKFDKASTQEMPTGTFGFWPAGMTHFVWAKGETVVQLHGIGPWRIEYLNPADDPRKTKAAGDK